MDAFGLSSITKRCAVLLTMTVALIIIFVNGFHVFFSFAVSTYPRRLPFYTTITVVWKFVVDALQLAAT